MSSFAGWRGNHSDNLYSPIFGAVCLSACEQSQNQQEGQHPLTGQRAANFRLLANQ